MEAEVGDMVVVRLWRWDQERLELDAKADHADRTAKGDLQPVYSISVWAAPVGPDGDVDATTTALMDHVSQYRSARWAAVTTDRRLQDKGFMIGLSEPPPKHYDVVLGQDLGAADLAGLEAVFNEEERRRFQ